MVRASHSESGQNSVIYNCVMTLEKHMTYHRHDPGGHITVVEIRNDAELKYHENLVERGYHYELFKPKSEPAPEPRTPRIHPGQSICESCEG